MNLRILSVGWHLNSSVCYFYNHKIEFAISEERFTRKKNECNFPIKSINHILKLYKLSINDFDAILITSKFSPPASELVKSMSQWSIKDYIFQQQKVWYPRLYNKKKVNEAGLFYKRVKLDKFKKLLIKKYSLNNLDYNFSKNRKKFFSEILNCDINRIHFVDHHTCHHFYSAYQSNIKDKTLSFVVDGYGDGRNASIFKFDKNLNHKELFSSDNFQICRLYRYMTLVLGMKPNEHEYKVMGLAPYGKTKITYIKDILNIFYSTQKLKGINMIDVNKPKDYYFHFLEKLKYFRFDNIAYSLQNYVENLLKKWVQNSIKKFKINNIIISGGASLNVKANNEILKLKDLKKINVAGAGSDESLCIGAAIFYAKKNDALKFSTKVGNLYLGKLSKEVASINKKKFKLLKYKHKIIVDMLLDKKIIARCAGDMEFGSRALGNRSVIADPKNLDSISLINEKIKNRDFWMPFAPVILDKYAPKYLKNLKKVNQNNIDMTIAFDTHKIAYDHFPAALHPKDKTARAQILTREKNSDFYDLLSLFAKKTNRGALLNTSFNLHGYPIVSDYKSALFVFENTDLDALILNEHILLKNFD